MDLIMPIIAALFRHEEWQGPAELGHASKLRDLVGPVLRVLLEARKRPPLHPLGGEGEGHAGSCRWSIGIRRVDSGTEGSTGFRPDSGIREVSTLSCRSGA